MSFDIPENLDIYEALVDKLLVEDKTKFIKK